MFGPSVQWLRECLLHASHSAISRCAVQVAPACLVEGLPALGNVLYMPARPHGRSLDMPPGLLVEARALAPLLQTRRLVAASTITVDGPREWIECMDRHDRVCARLHLLPDTDYLAWDALMACAGPTVLSKPARWSRHSRPASAQLLRFHTRWLGGLRVLGAEVTRQVSPLSCHLAGQIARAEAVPLQLAVGG